MVITNPNKTQMCHDCGRTLSYKNMYKITYNSYCTKDHIVDKENNVLCKSCLFKLYLKLDNIFPYSTLMNGTDQVLKRHLYTKLGIPRSVFEQLEAGYRIRAIKELRDLSPKHKITQTDRYGKSVTVEVPTMGLRDAKKQVDKWCEMLYGKDYQTTHFNVESVELGRFVK